MSSGTNLFLRPAPWGIGPGPANLQSVDGALTAVEMWLAVTPDRPEYRDERARMMTLHDLLSRAQSDPSDADLQSAKLGIKGMVRYCRMREGRRMASYATYQMRRLTH